MSNALRKPLSYGQATTATRISTQPTAALCKTPLFAAYEKALLKNNPSLANNQVWFHEIIPTGQSKAFFNKAALPVSTHLVSLFLSLERSLCSQPEETNPALAPIAPLLCSVSVDLDCFFIGGTQIKATLHFKPSSYQALIEFTDQTGRKLHLIEAGTSIALKRLQNNLGYEPPAPLCEVEPPRLGQSRLLSSAEVLNINNKIEAANEEKAQHVKEKIRSSFAQGVQNHPSLPNTVRTTPSQTTNQSNSPKFEAQASLGHSKSEVTLTQKTATLQSGLFDEGYLITRHWH